MLSCNIAQVLWLLYLLAYIYTSDGVQAKPNKSKNVRTFFFFAFDCYVLFVNFCKLILKEDSMVNKIDLFDFDCLPTSGCYMHIKICFYKKRENSCARAVKVESRCCARVGHYIIACWRRSAYCCRLQWYIYIVFHIRRWSRQVNEPIQWTYCANKCIQLLPIEFEVAVHDMYIIFIVYR